MGIFLYDIYAHVLKGRLTDLESSFMEGDVCSGQSVLGAVCVEQSAPAKPITS